MIDPLRKSIVSAALIASVTWAVPGASGADNAKPGTGDPVPTDRIHKPAGDRSEIDRRSPEGVVISFLNAAKAKDLTRLRGATALDAATIAQPKNRALFAAILDQTVSEDELATLAIKLEGFKILNRNQPVWTGKITINITKSGPNGSRLMRNIGLRKEKLRGWKVYDLGGLMVIEAPTRAPGASNPSGPADDTTNRPEEPEVKPLP